MKRGILLGLIAVVCWSLTIGIAVAGDVTPMARGAGKGPQLKVPAPIPQTGQTTVYATGDDGELQKGVPWPEPSFTDNGDGTVTDKLTGLMWVQDGAILPVWEHNWYTALTFCNDLNFAGYNDWRMPNVREMLSLIDYGMVGPALPAGHPFTNMSIYRYWTSTTDTEQPIYAFAVYLRYGVVWQNVKDVLQDILVLPVRGGK